MVRSDLLAKFASDGVKKQWRIVADDGTVITNEVIVDGSVQLQEPLNTSEQLEFGSCESACFSFQIYERTRLKNKVLTVYVTLDNMPEMQVGVYKVDSDKLTANRKMRDITAYDKLHEILDADVKGWYNTILPNLDSAVSLKQFRESFLRHFNLTFDEENLISDTLTIHKTLDASDTAELKGSAILPAICQLNASFGHIRRDGSFAFVTLPPHQTEASFGLQNGASYMEDPTYEEYDVQVIDKVVIKETDSGIETATTFGEGTNAFIIEDNFLIYDATAEQRDAIAEQIYNKVHGIYYRPFELKAPGNLCYEVGDSIKIETKYDVIDTYILERSFSGTGHCEDTYNARGTEKRNEQVASVSDQVEKLNGRYARLKKNIDGINSEVGRRLSDQNTEIRSWVTQQFDGFEAGVTEDNIVDKLNQAMTSVTVRANGIDFNSTGSFTANTKNFKVDAAGNVEINSLDAQATITGARIWASEITSSDQYSGNSTIIRNGFIQTNQIYLGSGGEYSQISPNQIALGGNANTNSILVNGIFILLNRQKQITLSVNDISPFLKLSGANNSVSGPDLTITSSSISFSAANHNFSIDGEGVRDNEGMSYYTHSMPAGTDGYGWKDTTEYYMHSGFSVSVYGLGISTGSPPRAGHPVFGSIFSSTYGPDGARVTDGSGITAMIKSRSIAIGHYTPELLLSQIRYSSYNSQTGMFDDEYEVFTSIYMHNWLTDSPDVEPTTTGAILRNAFLFKRNTHRGMYSYTNDGIGIMAKDGIMFVKKYFKWSREKNGYVYPVTDQYDISQYGQKGIYLLSWEDSFTTLERSGNTDTVSRYGSINKRSNEIRLEVYPNLVATINGSPILTAKNNWKYSYRLYREEAIDETSGIYGSVYISSAMNFRPQNDNTMSCGSSLSGWTDVFAYNGITQPSDERIKTDITDPNNKYLDFIRNVKPKTYKYKKGQSGRTHLGFIAQDIETLLSKWGIETHEFAGFVKTPVMSKEEPDAIEDFSYSLRYGEFIPLLLMYIKDNERRIKELEEQLNGAV